MKSSEEILSAPWAIMGILNVTPDSFYDGGHHATVDEAIAHGQHLIEQGVDIIDVGGESTRPESQPVSTDEESRRVLPVIEALAGTGIVVSVDTTKSEIARRAHEAGATWINDISAGRFDPEMACVAAKSGCRVVLMHSRETPTTMQQNPAYDDVVAQVRAELEQRIEVFIDAGVERDRIIIDPGFGFAKRFEDNLVLLRSLGELNCLGLPMLVGTSRKSFIGRITGRPVEGRLAGSLATIGLARARGARLFRVHDVRETRDFLSVFDAVERGGIETVY